VEVTVAEEANLPIVEAHGGAEQWGMTPVLTFNLPYNNISINQKYIKNEKCN
jgi:hypothetical protein